MSADAPLVLSSEDDDAPPMLAPAPAPTPTPAPAPALLADDGTRVPGLYIAPSSIPGLNEPGLWTSTAIAPGAFIAIYTGQVMTEDEHDRLPPAEQDAQNKYSLAFKGSPILVLPGAAPDLTVHPAAAANEPLRGGVANALVETQEAEVGGARYVFAALFACAAGIPAHTEVLWWYGASYAAVRKAMKYKAGRACSSAGHALTPSAEAIVRRVLAAGRRDDALYVRGDEEPGSSGESEADSDPDFEETPKRRRAAAQQPPRQQPSRRIVNTGGSVVASGGSVVDALFARLGLVATAMPAQKRTIDEMTTDADSSEPEPDDRPPPSPPFSALCRCLEALERGPKPGGPLPSADLRMAIIRRFFALHLPVARASHAHLLLLLLPSEDPRRYHLGPTRLAAAVARALGLPAALKEHLAYADCRGEDFGEVLRGLVAARVGTASGGALRAPLSTFDVNSLLTRHADGDATALPAALPRVGPLEAKWLARLFLRDLKIGAESWVNTDPRKLTLVKLVLNAYSDGLFDFYTHRGDVRVAVRAAQAARAARVCGGLPAVGAPRGVADPGMPYLDPSIAPGTYVAVQNAAPILSLGVLPKKLGPATMVSVGQKYDGERLQLHVLPSPGPDLDPTAGAPRYRRDGVEYRIFSRGGNNFTFRRALALPALAAALGHIVKDLGAVPEQRSLADAYGDSLRAAADARAQPVQSVILDAEVLVYDREKGQVEEFGFVQSMAPGNATSMAAVREGKKHLLVVVFDVLHLNGRDLVCEATPLRAREALLRSILEPIPTFVEVVPTEHVRADDEEALLASLGQVVRAKQEGLVLKALDSAYLPNGRASWFKLKPAAIPGVGDTLTLGLIGVRVGNGVNAGKITGFALGAIQNRHAVAEAGEPPRWAWLFNTPIAPAPIARVLTELCLGSAAVETAPLMRRAEPSTAVGWLHGAPTGADERLHMVARHPLTSVLAVEVTGQGFVRASASFGASSVSKYELRFPKIVAMRSPMPGVDLERIVGLRAYQELGEAAVLGPVTDARVRAVCDRVKSN